MNHAEKSIETSPPFSTEKVDIPETDSSDEALCEMLGISSLKQLQHTSADDNDDDDLEISHEKHYNIRCFSSPINDNSSGQNEKQRQIICNELIESKTFEDFERDGICIFPKSLGIRSSRIRRLCDELVWSNSNDSVNESSYVKTRKCDRTYETIRETKNSNTVLKRELTRLENFVNSHEGWSNLCHGYLKQCASCLMSLVGKKIETEMFLYKEKLNLKPSGGLGFAPHVDTPSLRVPFGKIGPSTFITIMVAIDNMTAQNGCLRVVKASKIRQNDVICNYDCNSSEGKGFCWSENYHVPIIQPNPNGNPDADGRAGAIVEDDGLVKALPFEDVVCESGDVVVFNGWVPHHSRKNMSYFPRRAVFLTYNPIDDMHDAYYDKMNQLRRNFKEKQKTNVLSPDYCKNYESDNEMGESWELNALNTIPTR